MEKNIQESFVGKTLNRKSSDIVPKKLELDEQSFFSLLSEYTDSLGITNFSKGDIVDTKSESGREFTVVVKKEVKRNLFKPVSGLVGGSFVVSLVVSPYSYFWGKSTEIPVFDLDFKILFYPNNNEIRIGIYVNNYKAKCYRKNGVSYEVVPRHFFRKSDGRFLDKSHDFFSRPQKFFELTKMGVDSDTLGICKNYIKRIADFKVEPEKGVGVLNLSNDSLEDSVIKVQSIFGDELFCLEEKVLESFTKKVSRKNSSELVSDIDYPDGVYILHETLGVKTVDSWNPKNNNGVVGILVVEGEHKIVVATEDAPEDLSWSKKDKLVNQPIEELEDAESDFNGEMYCQKLNSPDFPAAYYCKTYNKGGRSWYLPSTGELWLICRHLEEIQNALETVGGQKLITTWDEGVKPLYWSSTEGCDTYAWQLYLTDRFLGWTYKVNNSNKVRPVSKFDFSTLKESFTRKIRSKKNDELTTKADTAFVTDGVYILHESLGVKTVDGWNPKNNKGVVGILVIEDDHKIVVALEDSPENLTWSEKYKQVNQSVKELEEAESDFNGEMYCRKLNSPDYPAAYYCKTYNKGNRSWYLPSLGELRLIYNHLEEIQNALSIVGGQKFDTNWGEGVPVYWSSTERSAENAYPLYFDGCQLLDGYGKVSNSGKVRPVSNFSQNRNLKESFTNKIKSTRKSDLISKPSFVLDDGVYILHDILGVKTVDSWNPRNNYGVVGVLVVEDDHKIVIATEDAPVKLKWSKKRELINEPIKKKEDAESDFNGEEYCRKLNSPDFPAAYYCKTYNKGGRNWYLPSSGELRLIYNHLEEIQTALSIVGGQKLITTWDEGVPTYWSSTEGSAACAWTLDLRNGIPGWYGKVSGNGKVRPVSAFHSSLKESFTRKIRSKKNDELTTKADTAFVPDGVYILHDILGVKTVDGWNPKNNKGVVGILLIEDDHKIVVALKDSPKNLRWSKKRKLVNQPFDESEESDFNGEEYCRNLNSPDFPAAYYCLNYKKGNRSWYLPSIGELWLIYQHLEEIQNALSIVRGQRFVTVRGEGTTVYWSSTEDSAMHALAMGIGNYGWCNKIGDRYKVRPVSNFNLSELKESFTKKIRKSNSKEIVQDADTNAFNPLMDAKEFVNRLEECILSYKQPYVYGKKNPYNLEKFSFEMITSWPNTFKFNGHKFNYGSSELLFDVSNSKKPSFRIKLSFFKDNSNNIICYLTVGPIKPNYRERIYEDRLFQYIYDSKKRISFVENPEGVRFDDNMESIEPTLRNLNFILNDIRFLMDNWKILYKTYLKKNSFETWNEFYKMLPSQNNKGFDFDLKESFAHKISKKTSGSLKGGEMFGEMESFGEFDMLFKRFLKKHENQFSSCFTTNYPFKSKMSGLFRIGYKVVLKKDCPFEDGSDDRTVLRFSLDVFQGNIMNFPEDQDLNTPHGILTVAFYTELGPSTPQQINLANLEFIGGNESPVDFRFVKFKERREWEKPNFSYQLLFGLERFLLALVETMNNMDEQTWSEIGRTSANFNPFKGEACCGADSKIILDILEKHGFYSELHKNFSKVNLIDLNESFTKKISSKKNTDLVPDVSYPNGVYILHETLGVKTVEGWNPKNNEGVVGVLVVEDKHQLVVALEDSPENLIWSGERKLVNRPIENREDAKSDFNGEEYCRNLNSPDFPAAYYCLNYKKGGRNWYLPSSGELWLIYRHLEEIQTALSIVGGQRFVNGWSQWNWYWSSTERCDKGAWFLYLDDGHIRRNWGVKNTFPYKVRPVSNFRKKNTLKESFTRKIRSKKNDELTTKADTAFVPDGVYILHETLGIKTVDSWNPKNNDGVVGILLIEDEHKIVVALEDSPNNLTWSSEYGLINQPVDFNELEDAESDFNGEYYCQRLDSPNYPAAYYCKTYNKGGRNWYLPSSGELWLICNHFKEIQNALSIVGGQKLVATWEKNVPEYLSSTESNPGAVWSLDFSDDYLDGYDKVIDSGKVRPVSNFSQNRNLKESFTRKISQKKNNELISKSDTAFEIPDGVYILHQTLGVKDVEGWNPKNNKGVVGILVIEDDHKIMVALEDSPEDLLWSKERKLVNEPIELEGDAASDFNGEKYCINLNSPDFPAAYYCLNYKKGGRKWYLPSSGELWMIYNHFEEIQSALEAVGGKKFVTSWFEGYPVYWSSTECSFPDDSATYACVLDLCDGYLEDGGNKIDERYKVRPVSKFGPSKSLKESFTRKIRSKKNDELIFKTGVETFIPDGVYILHDTLGVKSVNGWNPKDNYGVIGILLVEDDHQIVVALEDAPESLQWAEVEELVNKPFRIMKYAASDFNGEEYCLNLNSRKFPAAYYCLNYKKGGRNWHLPSSGELWMIYNHLEEIQSALEAVGGKKFVSNWNEFEGVPGYWSSTETDAPHAWHLYLQDGYLSDRITKVDNNLNVRPVSNFSKNRNLKESFTRKISRKKNDELTIKADTAFVPDGVYILHETLGVKSVDGWNPEDNDGVVGVMVVEDDHKIMVALEDSPEDLPWSKKRKLINEPIKKKEDAESDFNGEYYCRKLNSPDFPAAYYCKTYNKGGRNWYLPSAGELRLIYNHLEEVQNALETVGGQKFVTTWGKWGDNVPLYWSSTEDSATDAWYLGLDNGYLGWSYKVCYKVIDCAKVRPVSIFTKNENLKESFTKKTTTKGRNEIIGQADNLVIDYETPIKGLIKKYGFSTIHKYVLSLSRGAGYKEPPYVRRHEPFTEDKMVTILGELEFDKSETSDNGIKVIWRKTKKFYYRSPIEKTEKFSELSVDEKRDIYKYLINWLNVRIDEDEKIEKMDKLPQPSRNVV